MKAAVCNEFSKPLEIEDVILDEPQEGEVRIRVKATAVCHSDIHCTNGDLPGPIPGVPGHETAGYVDSVGPNVTSVKPGDPVLVTTVTSGCGHCYYCTVGLRHLCENSKPKPAHHRNKKGQPLVSMAGPVAGFAEYTVVSERQLAKIPADFPMDRAALISCGVLTGYGAVFNRAQVKPLNSVAVVGTGGVGLNVIQAAAIAGAYPIIGVDILDNRLDMAKKFGATHIVNSSKEKDPIKAIQQTTSNRGADYVFITVGSAAAVRQGLFMAAPRGMAVIIGLVPMRENISFSTFDLIGGERMLTGCGGGSARLSIDVPKLIELYRLGRLKLDDLITDHYPIEKINKAMELMVQGKALRNIIVFD
jgi:S-(hydroxymethyl)glutathione dehydrogenase / alcohol dehydrogenase